MRCTVTVTMNHHRPYTYTTGTKLTQEHNFLYRPLTVSGPVVVPPKFHQLLKRTSECYILLLKVSFSVLNVYMKTEPKLSVNRNKVHIRKPTSTMFEEVWIFLPSSWFINYQSVEKFHRTIGFFLSTLFVISFVHKYLFGISPSFDWLVSNQRF